MKGKKFLYLIISLMFLISACGENTQEKGAESGSSTESGSITESGKETVVITFISNNEKNEKYSISVEKIVIFI